MKAVMSAAPAESDVLMRILNGCIQRVDMGLYLGWHKNKSTSFEVLLFLNKTVVWIEYAREWGLLPGFLSEAS